MNGAKNKFTFNFLTLAALSFSVLSFASPKPVSAIYPTACGKDMVNRSYSLMVCINSVGSSNLQVVSITKLRQGVTVLAQEHYVVSYSYDLPRQTNANDQGGIGAAVMTPARRILRLEKAAVIPASSSAPYAALKSVEFAEEATQPDGETGLYTDARKELILSEPSIEVENVRQSNIGLSLESGANFEDPITVEEMKEVAVARGAP